MKGPINIQSFHRPFIIMQVLIMLDERAFRISRSLDSLVCVLSMDQW